MPYRNCSDSFSPSDSSSVQHWPLMSCGPTRCEKAIIVEWKKRKCNLFLSSFHLASFLTSLYLAPFKGFKTQLYVASQKGETTRHYFFPKDRILSEFDPQRNTRLTIKRDALIKISVFLMENVFCRFQQSLKPGDLVA